jgi:hypothetical protein
VGFLESKSVLDWLRADSIGESLKLQQNYQGEEQADSY